MYVIIPTSDCGQFDMVEHPRVVSGGLEDARMEAETLIDGYYVDHKLHMFTNPKVIIKVVQDVVIGTVLPEEYVK